jgi:alkylation response protein AidB-like acyl-CoA dehydrogenase
VTGSSIRVDPIAPSPASGHARNAVPSLDVLALRDLLEAGSAGAAALAALDREPAAVALASSARTVELSAGAARIVGRATFAATDRPALLAVLDGAPGFGTRSGRVQHGASARQVDASAGDRLRVALVASDAPGVRLARAEGRLHEDIWEAELDAAPLAAVEPGTGSTDALARAHARHASFLADVADELIEATRARIATRHQFGVPIAEFQAVTFTLAAYAARWRTVRAQLDTLACMPSAGGSAATALLAYAGDLALATGSDLLSLHGAHGLTYASPAGRLYVQLGLMATRWGLPRDLRDHARDLLTDEGEPIR